MFLTPLSRPGVHVVLVPVSNWPDPCQFCKKVHLAACRLEDSKKAIAHQLKVKAQLH